MTSVFTQNASARNTWFKKRKKDANSRNTVGKELEFLELDHAVKTDQTENQKRRTLNVTRQHDHSWGFTLQSYGIHHTKTSEMEILTYVDYVDFGSPAYVAGMQSGDVILSINGVTMEGADHTSLIEHIQDQGDSMRIVVLFEDCVRKVDHHLRLRRLKNLLAAKEFELRSLELREKRIVQGYSLSDSRWSLRSSISSTNFGFPRDTHSLQDLGISPMSSPQLRHAMRHQELTHDDSSASHNDVSSECVPSPSAPGLDTSMQSSVYEDGEGWSSPNMVFNPRVDLKYTSLPSNARRRDRNESHVGNSKFYSPSRDTSFDHESRDVDMDSLQDSVFGHDLSRDSGIYQTWTGAAPDIDRDSGIYNTWSGGRGRKRRGEARSIGNSLFYVESEENLTPTPDKANPEFTPVFPEHSKNKNGISPMDYEKMGARPKSKYSHSTCSDSQLSVRNKKDKTVNLRNRKYGENQELNFGNGDNLKNSYLVNIAGAQSRRPSSLPIIPAEEELTLSLDIAASGVSDSRIDSPVFLDNPSRQSIPQLQFIPANRNSQPKCDKNSKHSNRTELSKSKDKHKNEQSMKNKHKNNPSVSPKDSPLMNMKKLFQRSPSMPSLHLKSKWSPLEFTRNKLRNSLNKLRRKSGSYKVKDSRLSLAPETDFEADYIDPNDRALTRSASAMTLGYVPSECDIAEVEIYATLPKKSHKTKEMKAVIRELSGGHINNEEKELPESPDGSHHIESDQESIEHLSEKNQRMPIISDPSTEHTTETYSECVHDLSETDKENENRVAIESVQHSDVESVPLDKNDSAEEQLDSSLIDSYKHETILSNNSGNDDSVHQDAKRSAFVENDFTNKDTTSECIPNINEKDKSDHTKDCESATLPYVSITYRSEFPIDSTRPAKSIGSKSEDSTDITKDYVDETVTYDVDSESVSDSEISCHESLSETESLVSEEPDSFLERVIKTTVESPIEESHKKQSEPECLQNDDSDLIGENSSNTTSAQNDSAQNGYYDYKKTKVNCPITKCDGVIDQGNSDIAVKIASDNGVIDQGNSDIAVKIASDNGEFQNDDISPSYSQTVETKYKSDIVQKYKTLVTGNETDSSSEEPSIICIQNGAFVTERKLLTDKKHKTKDSAKRSTNYAQTKCNTNDEQSSREMDKTTVRANMSEKQDKFQNETDTRKSIPLRATGRDNYKNRSFDKMELTIKRNKSKDRESDKDKFTYRLGTDKPTANSTSGEVFEENVLHSINRTFNETSNRNGKSKNNVDNSQNPILEVDTKSKVASSQQSKHRLLSTQLSRENYTKSTVSKGEGHSTPPWKSSDSKQSSMKSTPHESKSTTSESRTLSSGTYLSQTKTILGEIMGKNGKMSFDSRPQSSLVDEISDEKKAKYGFGVRMRQSDSEGEIQTENDSESKPYYRKNYVSNVSRIRLRSKDESEGHGNNLQTSDKYATAEKKSDTQNTTDQHALPTRQRSRKRSITSDLPTIDISTPMIENDTDETVIDSPKVIKTDENKHENDTEMKLTISQSMSPKIAKGRSSRSVTKRDGRASRALSEASGKRESGLNSSVTLTVPAKLSTYGQHIVSRSKSPEKSRRRFDGTIRSRFTFSDDISEDTEKPEQMSNNEKKSKEPKKFDFDRISNKREEKKFGLIDESSSDYTVNSKTSRNITSRNTLRVHNDSEYGQRSSRVNRPNDSRFEPKPKSSGTYKGTHTHMSKSKFEDLKNKFTTEAGLKPKTSKAEPEKHGYSITGQSSGDKILNSGTKSHYCTSYETTTKTYGPSKNTTNGLLVREPVGKLHEMVAKSVIQAATIRNRSSSTSESDTSSNTRSRSSTLDSEDTSFTRSRSGSHNEPGNASNGVSEHSYSSVKRNNPRNVRTYRADTNNKTKDNFKPEIGINTLQDKFKNNEIQNKRHKLSSLNEQTSKTAAVNSVNKGLSIETTRVKRNEPPKLVIDLSTKRIQPTSNSTPSPSDSAKITHTLDDSRKTIFNAIQLCMKREAIEKDGYSSNYKPTVIASSMHKSTALRNVSNVIETKDSYRKHVSRKYSCETEL